jgi:biofilm PGA synthesis N-glycosyltransferase PgaC
MLELVLRLAVLTCFGFLLLVYALYGALLAVSLVEGRRRRREHRVEDFETLLASRFTIPVSIVAAVYNEAPVVEVSVRSFLEQDYPEHDVIVVNDGSTDDTLDRLIEAFALEPCELFRRRLFDTAEVRAIYRSTTDPRLVVVDKENGGKADALNAAINFVRYRYVCGVDGDTVLARDALLRGMRLAISDPKLVVGVTSHLAISTRPERLVAEPAGEKRLDSGLLSNFQHLDYLRSFFNNRLGWTRLGFMMCTVGAFHIWRRDVLEELGGFSTEFTCEDIEFTFRVHEHFLRRGEPYRILSLPDSVGATEGPDTVRSLVSQRERWQRVIMETVWHYRGMAFRPRYRTVGLVGWPFYLVSEVAAPIFEVLSVAALGLSFALGIFDFQTFALLLGAMAWVNAAMTASAIRLDDLTSSGSSCSPRSTSCSTGR